MHRQKYLPRPGCLIQHAGSSWVEVAWPGSSTTRPTSRWVIHIASSQSLAQFAAHAPGRQPPLALAEPAFPMSGHTFEVMDQEFNAWWKQIMANKPQPEKMCDPHMAMVAARYLMHNFMLLVVLEAHLDRRGSP